MRHKETAMKHQYTCKSCGSRRRGYGKRWANVSPLCPRCYAYHCRHIITRSRLAEKIRRSLRSQARTTPRPSLWRRLFG
jgi:transposase-like protein